MIRFATSESFPEQNTSDNGVSNAITAAVSWIEDVLRIHMPLNNGFRTALANGEILCSLMNAIFPGSIKRINRSRNRASASDNLSLFLTACQTHCGIPKPRLFDISDFEDIFERGNDSYSLGEKTDKNAERVVISIFWLAKFVDQDPRWTHFPKLDYEAFADLLPWRVIQSRRPDPAETQPSQVTKPPSLPRTAVQMGNKESTHAQNAHHASLETTIQHDANIEQQKNNNGTDEDDWQSHLDAWRERRRRISLQQATSLSSFEQLRQEEERRKQETARDRLRQIVLQHSTIYNPNVPCSSISQLLLPSSPGVALFTGNTQTSVELREEAECAPLPPSSEVSTGVDLGDSSTQKQKAVNVSSVPCDADNPCVNGDSHLSSVSTADYNKQDTRKSLEHSESDSDSPLSSSDSRREVQLRLQSKPNCTEIRWGLALKALGPSNTAPFVVEHVKIGSAADVCELGRGDVLLQVNDTDLRKSSASGSEPMTLPALEALLDRLSRSGHVANICVLKKRADCLDGEDSAGSTSAHAPVCNEQSSDVDELIEAETALTVNRNVFRTENSIHVVKQLTHELSHISTADPKPTSKTPFESSFRQSPMPGETDATDLPNEDVSEQASLVVQPRVELSVHNSVSTRI